MPKVADWYTQGTDGEAIPKVSVSTITYRHEAFIGDAIEGVLMQEVDFLVEMVIGEDCSPDRSRDIILGYMERYPGFIQLSDYPRNLGAVQNFQTTIDRCRGEYIAWLDGDDYWTAPDKLRKQVVLMEAHPEYSLCFHPVVHKDEVGMQAPKTVYPPGRRPFYRLSDLHRWINMAPLAMVFRRSALPAFPSWFSETIFGDWALQVILATHGDIGYIDEAMGVYRKHIGGLFVSEYVAGGKAGTSEHVREIIKLTESFCQHLDDRRARPFVRAKHGLHYRLAHSYIKEGEREKAIEAIGASYHDRSYEPRVHRTARIGALFHLHAPSIYLVLRRSEAWLRRLASPVKARLVRSLRRSAVWAHSRR